MKKRKMILIRLVVIGGLIVLAATNTPLSGLFRYALVGGLLIPLIISLFDLTEDFLGQRLNLFYQKNAKVTYILYTWPLILVTGEVFAESLNILAAEAVLLSISLLTGLFFLGAGFGDIAKSVNKDNSPVWHFYRFTISLFLVIATFALIYAELFRINPFNFRGDVAQTGKILTLIPHFFYFSLATFATVGYGDIYPATIAARLCVSLEIAIGFGFVVYLLSNTEQFRRLFKNRSPDKDDAE